MARQRLLDQRMLSGFERPPAEFMVGSGWGGDKDGVNPVVV